MLEFEQGRLQGDTFPHTSVITMPFISQAKPWHGHARLDMEKLLFNAPWHGTHHAQAVVALVVDGTCQVASQKLVDQV